MKHFTSPDFWHHYNSLPEETQRLADKNYALLKSDPHHPSLHLKRVGRGWSARVGINFRALGKDRVEGIIWVWIGPHDEYDKLLS